MLCRFLYVGCSFVLTLLLFNEGIGRLGAAEYPEVKWILPSAEGSVQSVSFSPDGKLLAIAASGDTKSVLVWDMATGKEKFELPGHKRSSFVAFLPGGKELLANCGPDLAIQVWDLETKKVRLVLKKPLGIGSPYAVSPDGKWLAAMDRDGAIHQYSLTDGKAAKKIKGQPRPECLTYSPDGKWLVSGHAFGGLVIWDTRSGECLARPDAHDGWAVSATCFTADGKTFYTADSGRNVIHWDAATLKPTHKADLRQAVRSSIDRAALSPDGRTLALHTKLRVALYDVQGKKVCDDFVGDAQWGDKRCMAFSPDGKLLATGSGGRPRDNGAFLWKIPPPLELKK